MTFYGVPGLDWVLFLVALGLGLEAWLTLRGPPVRNRRKSAREMEDEKNK